MNVDPLLYAQIKRNLEIVQENIHKAVRRAGRLDDEVRLLVVTKTHPVEVVQCVIEAGAIDLGENYIEEARDKILATQKYSQCSWHMIGHVQSRKSNQVIEYFDYLHSLDSLKLAQRLNSQAIERNKVLPVLFEINLSGEEHKSGWKIDMQGDWTSLLSEVECIIQLPNLQVCGLMTIPPFSEDPENSRPYYKALNHLRGFLQKECEFVELKDLSMGMSGDYEVAIEEGATWIRVGQAILGPRNA